MNKWQYRKDSYLYFPCLITDLCMEAGVEIEADELREEPSGAFATNFKTRQRAGDATTLVDAQTLQRLVHQQNSLAKFVKQQFEWQKKVNAHSNKGKMVIEEPVLPDWMLEEDEEEDDVPISTMNLRAVKKEKAKRARSPAKKKKSPAKKKQKKVTYEEEELRSSEMDSISEEDADESRKVSMEALSEEEEEAQSEEEEGSSDDKTDIEADTPPTKQSKKPLAKPKPKSPEPKQPQPSPKNQAIPEPQPQPQEPPTTQQPPSQPEMPEKEPLLESQSQHHQQSVPKIPGADVITSAGAAAENVQDPTPKSPVKRQRTKSVPTQNPFGTAKRQKLQVKKKTDAPKGKPATATSAVFVASGGSETPSAAEVENETADVVTSAEREAAEKLAELQAAKEQVVAEEGGKSKEKDTTDAGDESTDVITSKEEEVAKAQVDPKEPVQVDPAELAKQKAWEEAKQRLAEHSAKSALEAAAKEASAAAASSGVVGSEETVTVEEGGGKKKEKKKKAQASTKPVRQSGRIKSGAVNK